MSSEINCTRSIFTFSRTENRHESIVCVYFQMLSNKHSASGSVSTGKEVTGVFGVLQQSSTITPITLRYYAYYVDN